MRYSKVLTFGKRYPAIPIYICPLLMIRTRLAIQAEAIIETTDTDLRLRHLG
jgi:hypothetical protein